MTERRLEITALAEREARAAFVWYFERDEEVAERFEAAFRAALGKIATGPGRFPAYVHGTRRAVLKHFPYVVVFAERGEIVRVLAVAHTKRRPGYWRARR